MIKRLDSPQIRRSCLAGRQVLWNYLCWRHHGDESQNPRLFSALGVFGSHSIELAALFSGAVREELDQVFVGLGLLIIPCALKTLEFCADHSIVAGLLTILSATGSLVSFRLWRRASLELEVLARRHQVAVLHRQRPGRPWLRQGDRLLWAWLYRAWPRCLKVMVLVKPATVIQWHRQGFRIYWRWRSRSQRPGRPGVNREIRDLIRQMSVANPLWGAPRIHGEMLKLGIEVSQATVGRHMVRRHGPPSPTWLAFLRNQIDGIAAIDMF